MKHFTNVQSDLSVLSITGLGQISQPKERLRNKYLNSDRLARFQPSVSLAKALLQHDTLSSDLSDNDK